MPCFLLKPCKRGLFFSYLQEFTRGAGTQEAWSNAEARGDRRVDCADAEGADGEANAEAPAGEGLRRTRRPRAATRNISELLADAEDSFGEEEEPEPEPDSEQGALLVI